MDEIRWVRVVPLLLALVASGAEAASQGSPDAVGGANGGWVKDAANPVLGGWQRLPANPIIFPGKDSWDADACYKPFAIFNGRQWLLWYNGRRGGREQIGLARHRGEDLGFQP